MRPSSWRNLALGVLPFGILLVAWAVVSHFGWVKSYFLPSPLSVITGTYHLVVSGGLWTDLKDSIFRIVLGYLLALSLGIPVGIALGVFAPFRAFFEPFNNFVRYTPLPAFIPLIVLWVGIGDANPITLIFLSVFWSLVVLVGDSVSNVPQQYLEMARSLGLGRVRCLLRVTLPGAMPGVYDGLRVSAGWAWSSVILAEMVGANSGLGHLLMESQRFLKTENVIAGIILVGIFGLMTDAFFSVGYDILFPWTERVRQRRERSVSSHAAAS